MMYIIMDTLNINETPAHILDQLSSYNLGETEQYIKNIQGYMEEQEILNEVLKKDSFEDDKEYIENFIEENKEIIEYQENQLYSLSEALINKVEENNKLKQDRHELELLLDNEMVSQFSEKLRNLKNLKEKLNSFLLKMGIIKP